MTEKMKIAMVCHFSNAEVRAHLPLDDRKLYNFVRKLFGLPSKGYKYSDFAVWDTNIIKMFKTRDDVELHVISACSGLKGVVKTFELDGVHYYFVNCDRAVLLKYLIHNPAIWHKLNPMRPRVRKIVRAINPDIVTLIGAENAYISGTVLGLEKQYPVLIKAQTIYNNPKRRETGAFDEKNGYVEKEIFNNMKYFSVSTSMHYKMFREYNETGYNFEFPFISIYPEIEVCPEKPYDFVIFAATISENKGQFDALKALAIVKKKHPDVKLNMIGSATPDIKQQIDALVSALDLTDNIIFTPFFQDQADLFKQLQYSRFAVLPCKLDYTTTTMMQAMYYGLPVVCYKTEGTPTLNNEQKCVLIAEMNDIENLAEDMNTLLENPKLAEELKTNARAYMTSHNNPSKIADDLLQRFTAIKMNYHEETEIPAELLHNPIIIENNK